MKLRTKLVISFVVVVFIPVLIVGIFLTDELRKNALENALEQTTSDMTRIRARISDVLIPPVYVSHSLFVDQRLKDLVNTQYENRFDIVTAYRNYTFFDSHTRYYNEIESIRLYVENETLLNNWTFIPVNEQSEVVKQLWYQEAMNKKGHMSFRLVENENSHDEKKFSITRMLYFAESQSSGVLVIEINSRMLNGILAQESKPLFLLDSEHNIVASNNQEWLEKNLDDITNSPKLIEGDTGVFKEVIFGKPSHLIVDTLSLPNSVNDLRVVSFITDEEIMEGSNHLVRLGVMVISISIVIALILVYSVSFLLSKRLSSLSNQMQKVSKGHLSTYSPVTGNDEIGQLSRQFNEMTLNLQELVDEVEMKNEEKRVLEKSQNEIKLKMLASQINPHFLFNTLETIRMKSLMNGDREVAHIVKRLGKLLRISIEVGGGMVPLEQELEMVRAYLEIQKFRFEERLQFELDIEPGLNNVPIPPLIIQPLVENAVIHGLERKLEGGKVFVKAKKSGENLLIQVIDNGIGITEQRKEDIYEALTKHYANGQERIGLKNVHDRLLLTYKTGKGLVIRSDKNIGTDISFLIPLND